jgi:hypothetical protein
MAAQTSLELAIGQVEADMQGEQRPRPVQDAPSCRPDMRSSNPANENHERAHGPLRRVWGQFFRRAGESLEGGVEGDSLEGRDSWMTELLARASREEDENYQDFAPKRASGRHA